MNEQRVLRVSSAREIDERCRDALLTDPIMNNLVASTLRHRDECDVHVVVRNGTATGMAMAWNDGVTITTMQDDAVDDLASALADADLRSVDGPVRPAVALAGRWADGNGGSFRVREIMRVLRYAAPGPDVRSPGEVAVLTARDVDEQAEWSIGFAADVGHPIERESVAAATQRQVDTGRLYGWRIDDRIVARLVVSHAALGVVRIGGVYTPDHDRGRGYASALTAGVSARPG